MRAIRLPSGIMVRQTISVRTKTYRHILICCQAICYGIMSVKTAQATFFNQSFVSDEKCHIITSHPATPSCRLMTAVLAGDSPILLAFVQSVALKCPITYILNFSGEWEKWTKESNYSVKCQECLNKYTWVQPFYWDALTYCGVKEHHIIKLRLPVCYSLCPYFRKVTKGSSCEKVKRHLSSDNSIPIHISPYATSIMIIAWAK